jgi:hypothetical protein
MRTSHLCTAALVAGVATPAEAQRAGPRSVSQAITVGLHMPDRLRIRDDVRTHVVAERGDTLTLRVALEVAANRNWTLRAITDRGAPIVIVADHGPCDYTRFEFDVQLIGVARGDVARALTLELLSSH